MVEERVRVSVEDHVATVTLARPEKHNALDLAMFEQIAAAAGELRRTKGVRAVVLHGDGPSFCAGLDLSLMGGDGSLGQALLHREEGNRANLAQRVCTDWIDMPVPVIAAIHGACLGGGLQVALGADIRFAAPNTRLSIREAFWGLVPDMGITETLPRLMPYDEALELTATGDVVPASDPGPARRLVTHVVDDPLASAQELAGRIARRSPDAVRAVKQLYRRAWREGSMLELETELQVGLLGSPNQIAAVKAEMSGEPPQFTDPGAA